MSTTSKAPEEKALKDRAKKAEQSRRQWQEVAKKKDEVIKGKEKEIAEAGTRAAKFEKAAKEAKVAISQRDNRIGTLAKKLEALSAENARLTKELKRAAKDKENVKKQVQFEEPRSDYEPKLFGSNDELQEELIPLAKMQPQVPLAHPIEKPSPHKVGELEMGDSFSEGESDDGPPEADPDGDAYPTEGHLEKQINL